MPLLLMLLLMFRRFFHFFRCCRLLIISMLPLSTCFLIFFDAIIFAFDADYAITPATMPLSPIYRLLLSLSLMIIF